MTRRYARSTLPARGRCGGAILLTVIFIMIVLGLLAAFLAESISAQYATGSLSKLARQADYAAASGIEWARDRALQGGSCAPGQISFAGFTVSVDCTMITVTEDVASYQIFHVDAVAERGLYGNADFVRRSASGRYSNR